MAFANEVADRLGDDPFLVGRFQAVAATRGAGADHRALAESVVDTYVDDIERELAAALTLADAAFVHRTFIALARKEIEHATLHPTVSDAREWLPAAQQVLDAALRSGRLLVRRGARDGDEILFRHDRLHDQLLGAAMAELIRERPNHEAISDPFFARVTGVALTMIGDENVPRVAKVAPLAVFEALRAFGNRATTRRQALFEAALLWVNDEAASAPSPMRRHVLTALFEADSTLVLPLTEPLRDSWLRRLVRLRAGDAASGAAFCGDSDSGFVFSDWQVQRATEHAMNFHRATLVNGTAELLHTAANDRARYGALTLAGWTAAPELARDAFACWKMADDRDGVMPAAMWAALRCARGADTEIFSSLVERVVVAPEKSNGPPHAVFSGAYRYSRNVSAEAIRAFDIEGHKDAKRARIVFALLQDTDDPEVFDLLLRLIGDWSDVRLSFSLRIGRQATATRLRYPGRRSREVLKEAWKDATRPGVVQWEAFELWCEYSDYDDLATLRRIDKQSLFYESALRARARLGDRSVAPELAEHIARTDFRGIYDLWFASHVWAPELYEAVDLLLRRVEKHMELREDCSCDVHGLIADLLVKIPSGEAERLMGTHWITLGRNRRFIQVALFIGTDRLVELATAAIRSRPSDPEMFKYVSMRFLAFHTDEDGALTTGHLDRLLPFASLIPEDELWMIIADAARRGWRQWVVEHFEAVTVHLTDETRDAFRERHLPNDEQLSIEFRSEIREAVYWLYDVERRAIPANQIVDATLLTIIQGADAATWAAACEVLERLGTRSDIGRFAPYVPDTSEAQIAFAGAALEVRHRSLH